MNETKEALQIWSALKPMITKTIDERTKSCVRSKKMVVVTAPNGSTIGVHEPFDTVTYNIPYSSAVSSAKAGDTVWVQWYFNNASTMIAMSFGDGDVGFFPEMGSNIGNNLDNATDDGMYWYLNSYTNIPNYNGGTLLVTKFNDNYFHQLAFSNNNSSAPLLFSRHHSPNGWGGWKQLLTETDGTWTPHLYDNNTLVRSLGQSNYITFGSFTVAYIYLSNPDLSGISTMLQIRNLPMTDVLGGSVYLSALQQTSLDRPIYIQPTTGSIYLRPNITSSEFVNPSSGSGVFSITVFGKT